MGSLNRSPNCSKYTDAVHIIVDGEASVPGSEQCKVELPITFSCQTSKFEAPDDITKAFMSSKATEQLLAKGCNVESMQMGLNTVLVGAREVEYSGKKLSELGMASSCYRVGNDPNDATHIIKAECKNQYEMTNDMGERVRDTNKKFLSNLAVCDVSDDAMPQLMEDARKVAAYNGEQNGFRMDRDIDLACTFSILPTI